jgi:glutamyl-tRNA reductase
MAAAAVNQERIFLIADQRGYARVSEMIELAAAHFAAKAPKSITVANRTFERGPLAARPARNITLKSFPTARRPDIIVTCTASSLPILGGDAERVVSNAHAPVIVDPAARRGAGGQGAHDVFPSIDDLARSEGQSAGPREAVAGGTDDAESVGHFLRWLEGRTIVPTIAALHGHHDGLRSEELERGRRMLAAGAPPDQVLEALARGLTNKFLHAPLSALNAAGEAERAELIALFQHVYKLPDPPADGH